MRIREATVADLPTIVSLNREVQTMHSGAFPEIFGDPSDEEMVDAFGADMGGPDSHWLVAVEEEQQTIGYLNAEFQQRDETWCSVSRRICYLGGIVVAPEFRRRGIAKALLNALKQQAAARDIGQIELDVWAFNDESRKAFASLGFQPLMHRMRTSVEPEGNSGED